MKDPLKYTNLVYCVGAFTTKGFSTYVFLYLAPFLITALAPWVINYDVFSMSSCITTSRLVHNGGYVTVTAFQFKKQIL